MDIKFVLLSPAALLTVKSSKVFESDLTVTPDSGDDGIDLLPLQSSVGHSQELALHNK